MKNRLEQMEKKHKIVKIKQGFCSVCGKRTVFIAKGYWLRDEYQCRRCHCIPRHRAFMKLLSAKVMDYREKCIHESSPSGPVHEKLKKECRDYSYSYFYPDISLGRKLRNGSSCQDLEQMTFEDNTFDIFITQDVLEHVNRPEKVFKEISRVLKPGGIHIFTVPIYPFIETRMRIETNDEGIVKYVLPKVYHGNPIDHDGGSLVTVDWGGDIVERIETWCGMQTEVYDFQCSKENFYYGLEADFLQVMISKKSK